MLRADALGRRYAMGHNPAWIPALVPEAFRDTFSPHESQGLTGDVATLIGLMALHSQRGTPDEVFVNQRWWNNRWVGPATAPRHGKSILCRLSGALQHIALPPKMAKGEERTDTTLFCTVPRPQTETFPRGFLVHVCLDNIENPYFSTMETMRNLESVYALVAG